MILGKIGHGRVCRFVSETGCTSVSPGRWEGSREGECHGNTCGTCASFSAENQGSGFRVHGSGFPRSQVPVGGNPPPIVTPAERTHFSCATPRVAVETERDFFFLKGGSNSSPGRDVRVRGEPG